jgi:hypothetical protein
MFEWFRLSKSAAPWPHRGARSSYPLLKTEFALSLKLQIYKGKTLRLVSGKISLARTGKHDRHLATITIPFIPISVAFRLLRGDFI